MCLKFSLLIHKTIIDTGLLTLLYSMDNAERNNIVLYIDFIYFRYRSKKANNAGLAVLFFDYGEPLQCFLYSLY